MTKQLEIGSRIISWVKPNFFNNCEHFNHQLRMIIAGGSGTGKTALLYKLLICNCPTHNMPFLDYNTLVLVSPSLDQEEYQIIIKGFKAGLSREHIHKLFELQSKVSDVDAAIKTIKAKLTLAKALPEPTEILTFKTPDDLIPPEELNHERKKKVLVVVDDSMNLPLAMVEDYFSRCRPKNINLIFVTQSFTKFKRNKIRLNCNSYILFKQVDDILKDPIFGETASADFSNFESFRQFCHNKNREN